MPKRINRSRPVRVLIVDDHPAIREALIIRLASTRDLACCGEADNEKDALGLVKLVKPDVAVIDISLKSGDGIDLIKRIQAQNKAVRILVWSMHDEDLYAERALRAGALGFITKEHATNAIVAAIRHILAGKIYLSATMSDKLLRRTVGDKIGSASVSPLDMLSDRELEVFRLIGQGIRTEAIAAQMHLSVKTVETYRDRIRQKLQLENGTALAQHATHWLMEEA